MGLGHDTDPYAATRRAVDASGEWPAAEIAGRTVVIKPNLVFPMTAETGVTTDPEVVRALVDLALEAGAAQVRIIEGGIDLAHFSACGYDFFDSYDTEGRVALVDLSEEPVVLTKVSQGMAYHRLHVPELLLGDGVFFISAAKLKTHSHTDATLAVKNLVGLAPVRIYRELPDEWRFVMHYRGLSQVIVDLNLVCPIDFAVVDGIVGMEGEGPVRGTPVELDLLVAGRNPVAVDRTCLWAARLPQRSVKHLSYAARKGMGPADMDGVEMLGDPFTPRRFAWPKTLPPLLEYPKILPARFVPRDGQEVTIIYRMPLPCRTRVEVVLASEFSPEVTVIRTLHDMEPRSAWVQTLQWDGRDDDGHIVPLGRYTVRVQANYSDYGTDAYGTGWVWVSPHST